MPNFYFIGLYWRPFGAQKRDFDQVFKFVGSCAHLFPNKGQIGTR